MKKIFYFIILFISSSIVIGFSSCGPSAKEKARLDSIRVADSLRVLDSIRIADSINAELAAAQKREELRKKVDDAAATIQADYLIKMQALGKIVYAYNNDNMYDVKSVTIFDVGTGKQTKIDLKESETMGMLLELKDQGNDKDVVATVHCGGSGPFCYYFTIDVNAEKVIKTTSDLE